MLLVVAALIALPTVVVAVLDLLLVPEVIPPEALLLLGLPAWIFAYTWWILGPAIGLGAVLSSRGTRRRPWILLGVVTGTAWAIGMLLLATSGSLPFPRA